MRKLFLKGVKKTYKQDDNNAFSLEINELAIKKGDFFGLIGPSGCGKTTLLKIIAGLYKPDTGRIFLDDIDITSIKAEDRNISMVFQQPLLFPHLTIEENIAFGLKIKKVSKNIRKKLVQEVLKTVELSGFEKRYPSELSGGQQQRVSIARSIVLKPDVLLMDEPFSAQDPGLREDMRKLIKDIHKKYDMTIVFVTHDRNEAFLLFDNMALINEGRLIEVGCPEAIYRRPSTLFSARFLKEKNIFRGEKTGSFFKTSFHIFTLPKDDEKDGKGYLIVRPEVFEIKKADKSNSKLKGRIEDIIFKQGLEYFSVKVDLETIEVVEKSNSKYKFAIGEKVAIEYDPSDVYFLKQRENKLC